MNPVKYIRFYLFIYIFLRWRNESLNYFDIIHWRIILVGLYKSDSLNDFHSRCHSSKYRMLTIKPITRSQCDKKLTTIGIRSRIRHTQYTSTFFFNTPK